MGITVCKGQPPPPPLPVASDLRIAALCLAILGQASALRPENCHSGESLVMRQIAMCRAMGVGNGYCKQRTDRLHSSAV